MFFPILYHITKNGKIKQWKISIQKKSEKESTIIIETGLIDGKMVIFETIVTKGKNIGKINQTSVFDQAILDAKSKYNKKLDEGYTIKSEMNKKTLIYPMLAKDFNKDAKYIVFPCLISPKLDGLRGVYENKAIHSRKLKIYPNLNHILEELKTIDLILDGELYSDELSFEEINGIVRKVKLTENDKNKIKLIQFRVYDTVSSLDFQDRYKIIKDLISSSNFEFIKLVKAINCESADKLKDIHDKFVQEGYEGLIIRNKLGKYEDDTRSYNLQKYKVFDDFEFEIVGFTEATGPDSGTIIWICITKDKKTFSVRPSGTKADRKKLFKNGNKYIGKMLNVKYFGETNDGIPRFPTNGIIRDMNY